MIVAAHEMGSRRGVALRGDAVITAYRPGISDPREAGSETFGIAEGDRRARVHRSLGGCRGRHRSGHGPSGSLLVHVGCPRDGARSALLAARLRCGEARTPIDAPAADQLLIAVAPWVPSPEPIITTLRAIEPRVGRATIATVLETEAAATASGQAVIRVTEDELQRLADELVSSGLVQGPVTCRVLFGRPADELARLAQLGGYRAIVVGPSGSWMHHLLQGHTRSRLERRTSVPVILAVPPGTP